MQYVKHCLEIHMIYKFLIEKVEIIMAKVENKLFLIILDGKDAKHKEGN